MAQGRLQTLHRIRTLSQSVKMFEDSVVGTNG